MAATKTERFAEYKGKTYKLEFLGETKFGRRAKLAFRDGSKEFWVEAGLVKEVSSSSSGSSSRSGSSRPSGRGTRTGCSCGSVEEYSKPSDCWTCRHDAE
jgi:hypothetical protein